MSAEPSDQEIDSDLALELAFDPSERYPEWSNDAMRTAYRAGWEAGRASR